MMPQFLQPILDAKKKEISALYANGVPQIKPLPRFSFAEALLKPGLSLIAEIKKASPSKGIIRTEFNPIQLAHQFEKNQASALSILTETTAFLGNLTFIADVKESGVQLPILRKDFILDPIQVDESIAAGADAILLIAAILPFETLKSLHQKAQSAGLDVLVEVHTSDELEQCLTLPGLRLIGINNRNLNTFEVTIQTASQLKAKIHGFPKLGVVAESGYSNTDHLRELTEAEFNAVLIGEGLAQNTELIDFFNLSTIPSQEGN